MTSSDLSRPQTPPHQPTYGVHMPHDTINNIVRHGFPGSRLISIDRLPTGKSFNNRIYFLKLHHAEGSSSDISNLAASGELELVLKVNGRFFGANKVENEVASLKLLEAYCPDIPAPKVYGWSGDGTDVTFASQGAGVDTTIAIRSSLGGEKKGTSHGGWILISRLPGDPISNLDLDEATMADIMRQLADMATNWRRHVPPQNYCGNSRLRKKNNKDQPADIDTQSGHLSNGTEVLIRGVLMDDLRVQTPIASLAEYYKLRIEKKLEELENSDVYAPNRSLVPVVRSFIAESLPRLGLDEAFEQVGFGQRKFVFTHYDLSPRNILISKKPLRITGIVDFEFSGFFSPTEEFLNDLIANDWPKAAYDAYLERLDQNGVDIPGKVIDGRLWEKCLSVENLVGNIAPWWLPGDREGEHLEEELRKVRQIVHDEIEKIEGLINCNENLQNFGC